MQESKTLWSVPDRARHFIIPDEANLPEGEMELRTPLGRQLFVADGAADAYEVSQEEAVAWLSSQFGTVVNQAKDAILDSVRDKMSHEPDVDAWFDERRRARRERWSSSAPQARRKPEPRARPKPQGARPSSQQSDAFSAVLDALKQEFGGAGENEAGAPGSGPGTGFEGLDLMARLRESVLAQGDPDQTADGLDSLAQRIEDAAATITTKLRELASEMRARDSDDSN